MHRLSLFCFRVSRCFSVQLKLPVKMPFYAVARGHKPGIYDTWADCQQQILAYSGARYKKFATKTEAEEFVQEHALTNPVVDRRAEDKKKAESATTEVSEKRKHDSSGDEDEENGQSSGAKKLNTGAGGDDKSKFSLDGDGFLIVYTDGACEFNGKHGAKAGIGVYFGKDHPLNVSEPVKGRATNNTAEIQAATFALEVAHASDFKKVAVHTDSQFMINCMTSWIKGWKKKGWVKSDGEPVKNKEDLMDLDKAMEGLAVKWVHVKGHTGHEGNEEADRLARKGSKLYVAET